RKRETGHGRGAAGAGERERPGALIVSEEPLPAPGLEAEGGEEQEPGAHHPEHLGVSERPAVRDEMARRKRADPDRDRSRENVEGDAGAPRAEEPQKTHLPENRPQAPGTKRIPVDTLL